MAGIVTNAYLYVHGEHRLQFFTLLKTPQALRDFLDEHPTGSVLYSDYILAEMHEWNTLSQEKALLDAAATGMALCPITAAIFDLLNIPLTDCVNLKGHPFDAAVSHDSAKAAPEAMSVPFDEQPLVMQADTALQAVLHSFPTVSGTLIAQRIYTMRDFRQHWELLPSEVADTIGLAHYHHVCDKALSTVVRNQIDSLTNAILKVAAAMPPWLDSLDLIDPFVQVRTRNALFGVGHLTFGAIAALSPQKLIQTPNMGRKSFEDLLDALTRFYRVDIKPISLHIEPIAQQSEMRPSAVSSVNKDYMSLIANDMPAIRSLRGVSLYATTYGALVALEAAAQAFLEGSEATNRTREIRILIQRLEGSTLEACGEVHDVSRERIRQVEGKALTHFQPLYVQLLQALKRATIPEGGAPDNHVTSWETHYQNVLELASVQNGLHAIVNDAGNPDDLHTWQRLLTIDRQDLKEIHTDLLCELLATSPFHQDGGVEMGAIYPQIKGAKFSNEAVLVPLRLSASYGEERDFLNDDLLPALNGMASTKALSLISARLHERHWPSFSIEVLAECVLLYWMGHDGDVLALPAIGTAAQQDRAACMALLKQSQRPLHIVEDIFAGVRPNEPEHSRPEALVGHWISTIQDTLPTTDEDFPVRIGNSLIATMRHLRALGITDDMAIRIARHVEAMLKQSPEREFSVTQLVASLKKRELWAQASWPDHWGEDLQSRLPNMLNVILYSQRPPNCRYMGRFIWKHGPWTDQPDTESRTQVYDFYKDLFREKRRPLRAEEMLSALKSQRGIVGVNQYQIMEQHGIVRLSGNGRSALYWDTDLGSIEKDWSLHDAARPSRFNAVPTPTGPSQPNTPSPITPDTPPLPNSTENDNAADVDAFLVALFEEERRPIMATSIHAAWSAQHKSNAPVDITENKFLVKLQGEGDKALYWLTTLNPDDENKIKAVQQDAYAWVLRNSALPIDQVASLLPRHQRFLLSLNTWERAALLAQHADMHITRTNNKRLVIAKAS